MELIGDDRLVRRCPPSAGTQARRIRPSRIEISESSILVPSLLLAVRYRILLDRAYLKPTRQLTWPHLHGTYYMYVRIHHNPEHAIGRL